jgi:hypothetical protein
MGAICSFETLLLILRYVVTHTVNTQYLENLRSHIQGTVFMLLLGKPAHKTTPHLICPFHEDANAECV